MALMLCLGMTLCVMQAQEQSESKAKEPGPEGARTVYLAAAHVFKLRFVLKEVEGGKTINSREYFTSVIAEGRSAGGEIRTGSKVPIYTGTGKEVSSVQVNYVDLGVNIDFKDVRTDGQLLYMRLTGEASSVDPTTVSPMHQPVIRQNRWRSDVALVPGKPTVVFSSDDVSSKRTMQMEVTATEVK